MSEEKHRPKARKKPPPPPVPPRSKKGVVYGGRKGAVYGGKQLKTPKIGRYLTGPSLHHKRPADGLKKKDTTKEI